MDESLERHRYALVFEGGIVAGRDPAEVRTRFASRFGEPMAKRVFTAGRVVLKRHLAYEAAVTLQRQLEGIGLTTRLSPAAAPPIELSLVEDAEPATSTPRVSAPDHPQAPPVAQPSGGFAVPGDRGEASASRSPCTTAAIDRSFSGRPARRAGLAPGYRVCLALVAVLMVLLPMVYLLVVLASGYATYWHVTSHFDWLAGAWPIHVAFLAYVAPGLAGGLLTLFLLKPFVASSPHGLQPVRLERAREPAVFYLVRRITEGLGTPMPVEIRVDARVNASASLRGSVFSRQLTLTIGMPLFYGLSTEQLAGILAHEFGHFTQRFGMRFGAVIHRINYWFYRQAWRRDSWDELVDDWSQADSALLNLSGLIARLGASLCRYLLVGLAYVATVLSRALSRQMELDADRCEVELTGSAAFAATAGRLRLLAAGQSRAIDRAAQEQSGRLPDNLPMLTRAATAALDAATRKGILAEIRRVNRSVFDTHPPDRERIAAAQRLARPGVFRNAQPAYGLLREPERLARHATLQWYRAQGLDVVAENLVPTAQLGTVAARSATDSHREISRGHAAGSCSIDGYLRNAIDVERCLDP